MDPLSDMLSLLKPRSLVSGGVSMSHNTAIQWPQHEGIKCYAVVSGQCWLSVDGVTDPVLLTAGDCYLLPPGPPFCLATHLSVKPVDFQLLRVAGGLGTAIFGSEGEGCYLVGGHFLLTGGHADMLLGSLPPIVHIRKESDKAAMRWS
ncbi:cupin domain-containing protein, partial [Caballeronia sp.]|uniref:cupin domain-containing protein n=1 Tax=Caballeronia sp. TaxID=1931223 RepID=UPI003C4FCEDC